MNRENRFRQPRAWDFQAGKNAPSQKRVAKMKKDIYPVISHWIEAPERAFNSQNRVSERKILRRRIERKPDSTQTVRRRQQMIVCDVTVIIPDKLAVRGRSINNDRQSGNCHRQQAPANPPP